MHVGSDQAYDCCGLTYLSPRLLRALVAMPLRMLWPHIGIRMYLLRRYLRFSCIITQREKALLMAPGTHGARDGALSDASIPWILHPYATIHNGHKFCPGKLLTRSTRARCSVSALRLRGGYGNARVRHRVRLQRGVAPTIAHGTAILRHGMALLALGATIRIRAQVSAARGSNCSHVAEL